MTTNPTPLTLAALNAMERPQFVAALGEVFEYAPWVAETAALQRPFASVPDMHRHMMEVVQASPREQVIRFLCGHPELSAHAVHAGTLTSDSLQEQQGAGLGDLPADQADRLNMLNRTYRGKHGFPFIACVRHYTRTGLFAELSSRSERDTDQEMAEALRQIGFITGLRLQQRVQPG